MSLKLEITIMSGVEDGLQLAYNPDHGDGQFVNGSWLISVGRREESDICLRHDTYASRLHAYICWENDRWWLQDCNSTNGTFMEQGNDVEARVHGTIPVRPGQMFRVGHTWMRIEQSE